MNVSNVYFNDSFLVLELDNDSKLGYPVKNIRRVASNITIANILVVTGYDETKITRIQNSELFQRAVERASSLNADTTCCISLYEKSDDYLIKLEDFLFSFGYEGLTHYFFIGKTSELIQKLLNPASWSIR